MTPLHRLALVAAACVLAGATVAAKEEPPAVSHDGLVLQEGKVASVVYVRPGVDFSRYRRVAILECPVAFRKDWEKDHRRGADRVSAEEMEQIKAGLSAEFLRIFTEELRKDGGYAVATGAADDVLVLRPAIVDLDVTAPDTLSAGRSYTLSESAGAMTLYLELFDSVSGQILARAVDREADRGGGSIQWQNRVTNRADADRILRRWARALRAALDEVHGKANPRESGE
jgi:hypothetical protein